ncbi:MAG: hypothetical protein AB7K09_18020 [Planctomycetota bacterium]
MLTSLADALARLADLFVAWLAPAGTFAVILGGALFTALLARVAFAVASPVSLGDRGRHTLLGALLGFWLYRGSPAAMFRQLGRMVHGALMVTGASLPPVAVMIVPAVALFLALERRAGIAPAKPGDVVVLSASVAPRDDASGLRLHLPAYGGVVLEREANIHSAHHWQLRVVAPGVHQLAVQSGNAPTAVAIPLVAEAGHAIITEVVTADGAALIPHDSERDAGAAPSPLPVHVVRLQMADLAAPPIVVGTWRLHWIVAYLLASSLFIALIPAWQRARRPAA